MSKAIACSHGKPRLGDCNPCRGRRDRELNKERCDISGRKTRLKRKFGITPLQYEKMLKLQGGVCAICFRPPKNIRLAVDHDHATKRVRCLACFNCNRFKIGRNTIATAKRVLEILVGTFDGRSI